MQLFPGSVSPLNVIVAKPVAKLNDVIVPTKISPSEWNNWQESLAEIVFLLYISYKEQEKYDKAEALLNNWIAKNPNDENATKLLEEIIELKLK